MLRGLSYEDVWVNLKPIQVKDFIDKYDKIEKNKIQIQYNLCWLNGLYTHIAIHNGKSYPEKPEQIYENSGTPKEQTDAEQDIMIDFILQKINTKS